MREWKDGFIVLEREAYMRLLTSISVDSSRGGPICSLVTTKNAMLSSTSCGIESKGVGIPRCTVDGGNSDDVDVMMIGRKKTNDGEGDGDGDNRADRRLFVTTAYILTPIFFHLILRFISYAEEAGSRRRQDDQDSDLLAMK